MKYLLNRLAMKVKSSRILMKEATNMQDLYLILKIIAKLHRR